MQSKTNKMASPFENKVSAHKDHGDFIALILTMTRKQVGLEKLGRSQQWPEKISNPNRSNSVPCISQSRHMMKMTELDLIWVSLKHTILHMRTAMLLRLNTRCIMCPCSPFTLLKKILWKGRWAPYDSQTSCEINLEQDRRAIQMYITMNLWLARIC
jgi:hypothetical protein